MTAREARKLGPGDSVRVYQANPFRESVLRVSTCHVTALIYTLDPSVRILDREGVEHLFNASELF